MQERANGYEVQKYLKKEKKRKKRTNTDYTYIVMANKEKVAMKN